MTGTHRTVADQLRAAGHDPGILDGKNLACETAVPATMTGVDGTLITGLAYQTDYDASQQYGVATLRTALTSTDPRRMYMTKAAASRAAVFSNVTGFVLCADALPARTVAWGDPLAPFSTTAEYPRFFDQQMPYAQRDDAARDAGWRTMDELRAIARGVGLSPLPRTKAAMVEALTAHPGFVAQHGGPKHPERWPAYFRGHLVVRADTGPAQVVTAALVDAIRTGSLAVGNFSGPFSTGLFLYDVRDETLEIVADREAQFDWHDARMTELDRVEKELRARGHRWHFLGRPSVLDTGDGRSVVRYWLNGSSHYTTGAGRYVARQPFGWYTLDELAAEKFVDDADRRQAEQAARR